jgi:hypothetical protein
VLSFIGRLGRDRYRLVAFCLPLAVYLIGLNGKWSSDYPTSILGMQYAMWARHSLSLGTSGTLVVQSADLSSFAGNFYSAISPGFAILSFPFAALGFVLDGNTLNLWGWSLISDEAFVAICSAVAVTVVYETAKLYASEKASLVAALALAFATPLWPASTALFFHGVSLMFSTLSVYSVLRFAHGKGGSASLVASGVFLGLAGFVEYVALLFVVPVVLYLAVRRFPGAIPKLLAGFSIGPAAQLAYNYVAFQNPFLFPEALKTGASGSLLSRFDLHDAIIHVAYYLVSPYRGLFVFSPIAVLGVFALLLLGGRRIPRWDALLFGSVFAITLVTYSSWTDWDGGLFYGPRFLILGLPALVIPLAAAVDEWPTRSTGITMFALFVASSFIEGVGALSTAFGVQGDPSTFELTVLNLPWLLQGKLDAWWISMGNLQTSSLVALLPISTFAILWLTGLTAVLRLRMSFHLDWPKTIGPELPPLGKTKTMAALKQETKT